jgi:glycosyltransferase involved in cell wall biosynthesis
MHVKKLILLLAVLALLPACFTYYKKRYYRCDVAVMGPIQFADGIGRQSIGLIDMLKNSCTIQYCKHGACDYKDVSPSIRKITSCKYRKAAKVLVFESPILGYEIEKFPSLPEADIRIAYSMFESTKIPMSWVVILNALFDAVAVPDPFLVSVYKNSGVTIPIFTVPLGMYLDPFLQAASLHTKPKKEPFVFGNLGSFCSRKSQLTLIQAFAKEFGNNPSVLLLLNGRAADPEYAELLQNTACSLGLKNVSLTSIALRQKDYIRMLKSIHCYVSASSGEGFSLQPREALAMGLPSIVTDNTGQKTICHSHYVKAVPSLIPMKAKYSGWSDFLGEQFGASVDDLALALRDVYEHYDFYAQKAIEARGWVTQYAQESLFSYYKTLVHPEKVVLSDKDEVKEGILYTTSTELKERYEEIQKKQTFLRTIFNSLLINLSQS